MMEEIKVGIYKHYKNKDYKVLFKAIDSETKEELVIYQSLADGKIWARPKQIFLEQVEVDGQKKPRFQLVAEEENDWQKKYLRALADYQNLMKQTAKEKMEFAVFANEQMLKEILPVYDHLKMSLEYHTAPATPCLRGGRDGESTDHWLKGVEHVVKQFKDALNKIGVEKIEVKNKKFDHNTMEAVGSEEMEDESLDGQVAKQVKAGYKLNGKVIEAAKVIVYKFNNN